VPEVLTRQTRRLNILPGALALNLHPLGLTVDEALAAREALERVLEAILGCEICKAGEGNPLPFERAMVELLFSEWGKATKKGTSLAVEGLMARDGDLSPEEMEGILGIMDNTIEESFGIGVEGETYKIFNGAYRRGKTDIYHRFKMENVIDWDAFDKHAINWLDKHHLYWIGGYYNKTISGKIGRAIGEGMKEGLGRQAIGERLKDFFQKYPGISNKPDVYWTGLAANGMNRARNFGMIKGYQELGIEYLEVLAVMDERTSEICKMMNGRIIPVANAAGQRDAMMAAESPEDIKTISPWLKPAQLKGLDTKGIMGKGVTMPPYHFHCRTTVVEKRGQTPNVFALSGSAYIKWQYPNDIVTPQERKRYRAKIRREYKRRGILPGMKP